jgi:hypothetical protein
VYTLLSVLLSSGRMVFLLSTHRIASSKSGRLTFAGEEITFLRMILTVPWVMAGT